MGVGKKSEKPGAAGARAFGRGGRVSSKDAEAYARGKAPKTSPFARAKAAAKQQGKGGRK